MNSKQVTVIAQLKAKPGQEGRLREELTSLLAPSRAEEACLNYDLHRACDNAAWFLFHENWKTKADLDAHLQRPYVQSFLAQADALLAEPPQITLWEKVG